MIKQDDGSYLCEFNGETYTFLNDDEMYRRFYAGVPIEDIAKARGCSVMRAKDIIKRQRLEYERNTMRNTINSLVRFDKTLARLDPSGVSATTLAHLQPMRKFLESLI